MPTEPPHPASPIFIIHTTRVIGSGTACHRLRGGGNARLLSSSPPTAEGRRCAAPIERQRATPSVSEADATTPPMVRASASNPEGSECSEISDYGNYALRQRAAPSAATPPLCFLGRTFGTHSLYIALIPAQLRKCRAMGRHATLLLSLWRSDLAVVRGSDQRG